MAGESILIVEDEGIVAADLESLLTKLGYRVIGTVPSGDQAIARAEQGRPDLVLMDIRLKGAMDGIEAAEQITAQFNIPVTYLTAYADEKTLGRAKATMPFGYILKPFNENSLRAAVEVALYKHKMEAMMSTLQNWHAAALRSIPLPVIATDKRGAITFVNERAEALLGWPLSEAYSKAASDLLGIAIPYDASLKSVGPLESAGVVSVSTKPGKHVDLRYSLSPSKDAEGVGNGFILVLHAPSNA